MKSGLLVWYSLVSLLGSASPQFFVLGVNPPLSSIEKGRRSMLLSASSKVKCTHVNHQFPLCFVKIVIAVLLTFSLATAASRASFTK